MSLLLPSTLPFHRKPYPCSYSAPSLSGSLVSGEKITTEANRGVLCFEGTKERVRELFHKVQLSVSSYDTAWVALVPSPSSSRVPCFPACVDWLLDNQLSDGSWGRPHHHPSVIKDALSSTLASVIALKRWCVGEEQINKGLHFIKLNIPAATDENQCSPIGFEIIFPGMLEYAKELDLNLPFEPKDVDSMLHRRKLELRRCYSEGRKTYLAYTSEGMGKLQNWEMVMKYQRKNGSLFNSPSTTAAAYMHLQDSGCFNYLYSLLKKLGNAVPTVYPLDVYARLCMVDNLERLGIERHFRQKIKSVLDEVYSCWLQGEEEIFLDTATCAMAFRILRLNGYDVSSDESALEEQHSWSDHFLKEKLLNGTIHHSLDKYISQEVDDTLKLPFYANLERVANRRNIEHYNVDSTCVLKTSYCSLNIRNEDFLNLAVEDFNVCQSIHREELKYLERWVVENRLDKLKFARQKSAYCYFSAAGALFSPELSDARLSWAKNGVLTTVVDDFFDIGGSIEELENLIQLVEKWDVDVAVECCSDHVKILFSALHDSVCDIGVEAFKFQGRNVTSHIIDIWLNLLHSMLRESKWVRDKSVPTMEEYMTNGFVSFALGPIVLPALYLVGPVLTEEVVSSSEYQNLFMLMSTSGRLLNDIRGFEVYSRYAAPILRSVLFQPGLKLFKSLVFLSQRESKEGKLNAVSLHMVHGCEDVTTEESMRKIKSSIVSQRRELLRLVLEENGSLVPRACKDLFWKMSKVLHLFYMKDDGFTSHGLGDAVKAVIHEPIVIH